MAIIKCNECGAKYSDKAPGCPKCSKKKNSSGGVKTPLSILAICLLTGLIVVGLMNYKAIKENNVFAQASSINEKIQEKKPTFNKIASSEAKFLKTSLELYYTDHFQYPAEVYELDISKISDSILIRYQSLDGGQDYFVAAKHEFGDKWYSTTGSQVDFIESEKPSLPQLPQAEAISLSIPTFDTESYCTNVANAAGGSYQVKEYCLNEENKSKRLLSSKSTPEQVMNYCSNVARAAGGTYATLVFCINEEMAAKQRLNN